MNDILRRRIERAVQTLIDLLDEMDKPSEDLEDTGDEEPDDSGVADRDALALIERARPDWYRDEVA